jgi:uncharacterized RDD family membrane protein YckC
MQWYYAINSQRQGPVSQAEFEKLVADGVIKPETLVWQQGMAEWKPYGAIAGSVPTAGGEETEICAVSGKRYPKREMIQYEGRWISAEHRDQYFQQLREGVVPASAGGVIAPFGYGGFWIRFVAKFIDGIALWIVSTIINVILAIAILGTANIFAVKAERGHLAPFLAYEGLSLICNLCVGLSYAWFFISRYQATPGKMAMGLKLLRADGSNLSTGRIIGRHFAEWLSSLILFIGYIMAGFDEEKRTLHDRICDTRVVRAKA